MPSIVFFLSGFITEPNINFIACAKIKIYGGVYPIPLLNNHLCSMHNRLKYIFSEFAINTCKLKNSWQLGKLKSMVT